MSCDRQHQNTFITLLFGSDRYVEGISYGIYRMRVYRTIGRREREREREIGIERDIHVSAESHTSHVSLSGMDRYIR